VAVAIARTADPTSVSASSSIATYSAVSIGTAAADRIVAIVVTSELTSASPNSVTIDYGSGPVAMTGGSLGNFLAVHARIFYLPVPTGTTADFAVTFGANTSNTQNHVSVYKVTGAALALSASGNNGSTDMDVTAPLTTGSVTVPSNGGFLGVAAGAITTTTAKAWANATEDLEVSAGGYCHTAAIRTTSGTVTITVTGTSNNEDGALSWVIFKPGYFVAADAGSYALTGADAALRHAWKLDATTGGSYALTGTDTPVLHKWKIAADGGSYALTGTDATLTKAGSPSKTLAADAGSYALSGSSASVLHSWKLAADSGSYALSGANASLLHAWKAASDAGAYALTGTNASLLHSWKLAAADDAGSYSLTGTDAALLHQWKLAADSGAYTLTGTDASLSKTTQNAISAESGSYALTGTDASVLHSRISAADGGSYSLDGTSAALLRGWAISADAGSYAVTGTDANLTSVGLLFVEAGAGSYVLTGKAASLFQGDRVLSDLTAVALADGRVIYVAAEDRSIIVLPEDRIAEVMAEMRTANVGAEIRTVEA
jgi:hypothetical protein